MEFINNITAYALNYMQFILLLSIRKFTLLLLAFDISHTIIGLLDDDVFGGVLFSWCIQYRNSE